MKRSARPESKVSGASYRPLAWIEYPSVNGTCYGEGRSSSKRKAQEIAANAALVSNHQNKMHLLIKSFPYPIESLRQHLEINLLSEITCQKPEVPSTG